MYEGLSPFSSMDFPTESLTAVVAILVVWRCINSIRHHIAYVSAVICFSLISILKSFVVKYTKCWVRWNTNFVPNCVQISPQGE